MQRTNEEGIAIIKHFEGFSSTRYVCPAGYNTIGYGHRILAKENFPPKISESEATKILRKDVCIAEDAVRRCVSVPLQDCQFSALVSFVYNVGEGTFRKSTLMKIINARKHEKVPEELQRWVFAKGKKLPGLQLRRDAEGRLYAGLDSAVA